MPHRFYTVDVFTAAPFGGNPLAVFPDARGLDGARMQAIAREMNLSESAFVLPPETDAGTFRVRIFTPAAELPFAGHPTLGTAFLLARIGQIPLAGERVEIVLEERVGPVPVSIEHDGERPISCRLTAARPPEAGPEAADSTLLEEMLGLAPGLVGCGRLQAAAYSCGVPFLFVPLRDEGALARAALDTVRWRDLLADGWAQEVFVFTPGGDAGVGEGVGAGVDFRARMFAPRLGVPEDPATGSAAAAFAGYLGDRAGVTDGTLAWTVEQGVHMGRPSLLRVEAELRAGEVVAARVGGRSVLVSEGTLLVS